MNGQVDDLRLFQVRNYHEDDLKLFLVMTAQELLQVHVGRSDDLLLFQVKIDHGDGQVMI